MQDFDDTFDQLRCVLQRRRNLKRRIVVGRDFKCQLNVGVRGIPLQNLSDAFGLQITKNNMTDCENDWTFRSMMGEKQRIST